jgi:hypothetical protein
MAAPYAVFITNLVGIFLRIRFILYLVKLKKYCKAQFINFDCLDFDFRNQKKSKENVFKTLKLSKIKKGIKVLIDLCIS